MARVAWWALLSSACAPVLLIGGWATAATLQPAGFDPTTQTISALAAYGATDRWLMTSALISVGLCHLITAIGLRVVAFGGRLGLACGGVATVFVGLFPEPNGGTSLGHLVSTGIGFTALAFWPSLAAARGRIAPWILTAPVSLAVTATMLVGGAWFLLELHDHGAAGAAERALTGAQTFWPLVVVFCLLLRPWPRLVQTAPAGTPGMASASATATASVPVAAPVEHAPTPAEQYLLSIMADTFRDDVPSGAEARDTRTSGDWAVDAEAFGRLDGEAEDGGAAATRRKRHDQCRCSD
jgi:hypothetical membrane protein